MNLRMSKTVGAHDVFYQRDKSIHVLATSDAGTFALIDDTSFDLLLPCFLSISPERHNGIPSFRFIVR